MSVPRTNCEYCGGPRTFDTTGRLRCFPCRAAAAQDRRTNERIAKCVKPCKNCGAVKDLPYTKGRITYYRCRVCKNANDGMHRTRTLPSPFCKTCGSERERDTTGQMRCIPCRRMAARKHSQDHYYRIREEYKSPTPFINRAGKTIATPKPPKPLWQPAWAAQSKPEIVAAVRDYRKAARSLGVGG